MATDMPEEQLEPNEKNLPEPISDNGVQEKPIPVSRKKGWVSKLAGPVAAGTAAFVGGYVANRPAREHAKPDPRDVTYRVEVDLKRDETSDPLKPKIVTIPSELPEDYSETRGYDWRHTKHKTVPTAPNKDGFIEQGVIGFTNDMLEKYGAVLFGEYHDNPLDDAMLINIIKNSNADCFVCELPSRLVVASATSKASAEIDEVGEIRDFIDTIHHPEKYDNAQKQHLKNIVAKRVGKSNADQLEEAARKRMEIIIADADQFIVSAPSGQVSIIINLAMRNETMSNPIQDARKRGKKIIGWFGKNHISSYPDVDERTVGIGLDNVLDLPGVHFNPSLLSHKTFNKRLESLPYETEAGRIMLGNGNDEPDYVILTTRRSNGAPTHDKEGLALPDNHTSRVLGKILDLQLKEIEVASKNSSEPLLADHLYCIFKDIRRSYVKAIHDDPVAEARLQKCGKELDEYLQGAAKSQYSEAKRALPDISSLLNYEKIDALHARLGEEADKLLPFDKSDLILSGIAQALQSEHPASKLEDFMDEFVQKIRPAEKGDGGIER